MATLCALILTLPFSPVKADTKKYDNSAAKFASGTGNIIFLAAAIGLPLAQDGAAGKNHALRTADAIGTSALVSEVIKNLVHEQRPDHSEHDSFPSGHATAAFAAATMESAYHPKEAPLWYAGATLIAASRTTLHRHFAKDVIAGGLLGFGTAKLELASKRGLVLSPVIEPGDRVGFNLTAPFH